MIRNCLDFKQQDFECAVYTGVLKWARGRDTVLQHLNGFLTFYHCLTFFFCTVYFSCSCMPMADGENCRLNTSYRRQKVTWVPFMAGQRKTWSLSMNPWAFSAVSVLVYIHYNSWHIFQGIFKTHRTKGKVCFWSHLKDISGNFESTYSTDVKLHIVR